MLAALSVAELLGMSLWFAASAVASELGHRWSLDASGIGWLTSIVQLGFVVGTALSAVLNLADIIPSRWYFSGAALAAAGVNAALTVTDGYSTALALRFATGFFLAGVYPPAMKMAATWFRARRGLAIGTVVGALVIGKSTPYFVHAFPSASPTTVILVASAARRVRRPSHRGDLPRRPLRLWCSAVLAEARRHRRREPGMEARDGRIPRPHVRALFVLDVDSRVHRRESGCHDAGPEK